MSNLITESVSFFFSEHKNNKKGIYEIAKKNMQQQTLRTSLGIGWVFFRDVMYFSVFIMFRFLMSGSSNVEGMNFILFLMLGMIPWNFMNECINGGVSSIKSNKSVLSSMKFPIVVLPTIEIIAIFMKRMFTLIILLLVIIIFGDLKDVTWWMFCYYFFAMFIFMVLWNQIFSAIIALSNDFEQLYKALASVLFYTMPIIWSFEVLGNHIWLIRIFKLNPFVYITEGFREACVLGTMPDLGYTLYFWGLSLVLLIIGAVLQFKLRRHYVDLI